MDYLNGLDYKWVHYGSELMPSRAGPVYNGNSVSGELFGNHVRRINRIGVGRDNWPPQGNRNTAEKLAPNTWLINSVTAERISALSSTFQAPVTEYDDEPADTYYCWFFTTINHEQRSIFYTWIKGDIRPHTWTLRGQDKNAEIVFNDCQPGAPLGYYEGDKQVIPVDPLLRQAKDIHSEM
jgi:hypothetical protein